MSERGMGLSVRGSIFLSNGVVKALGECLVYPVVGRVNNSVAVFPLVPGCVP